MYPHGTGKHITENIHHSAAKTGGHADIFHVALDFKFCEAAFSHKLGWNTESIRPKRQQDAFSSGKSKLVGVSVNQSHTFKCQRLRDETGKDASPFVLSNCRAK